MKKSILFVDDDVNLIQGLKRSLRGLLPGWDLFFAFSAEEALGILERSEVDLIVSDMRMPGIGGVELLETISERYPQVIRFVLSGHIDQELAHKSTRVAHQFIAKPCDTHQLVRIIQHSFQLRDLQKDPRLNAIITSIKKLPSLPALYVQLVQEMESPEVSSRSIATIISKDITMTAKTLQLVNSAFYGMPSQVTNLVQAVTILGINTLKSLVLSQQVFSQFRDVPSEWVSLDALWDHSINTGNLARIICRSVTENAQAQDDAQVAGVMHDIGKLIQLQIPGFYPDLIDRKSRGMPALEAEYEILGTSHAELGAYLLGLWALPDPVVQAAAFHHLPSRQEGAVFSPLTSVHGANHLMNTGNTPVNNEEEEFTPTLDMRYLEELNLTDKLNLWKNNHQAMMERISTISARSNKE